MQLIVERDQEVIDKMTCFPGRTGAEGRPEKKDKVRREVDSQHPCAILEQIPFPIQKKRRQQGKPMGGQIDPS